MSELFSVGNCRVVRISPYRWQVIDDIDRILLSTAYRGIADRFKETYNHRGSEFNLTTGKEQEKDQSR